MTVWMQNRRWCPACRRWLTVIYSPKVKTADMTCPGCNGPVRESEEQE